MGLALLLSSVAKSPQMTSNDVLDVICVNLGLPALNYNFAHQVPRHVCFKRNFRLGGPTPPHY